VSWSRGQEATVPDEGAVYSTIEREDAGMFAYSTK